MKFNLPLHLFCALCGAVPLGILYGPGGGLLFLLACFGFSFILWSIAMLAIRVQGKHRAERARSYWDVEE